MNASQLLPQPWLLRPRARRGPKRSTLARRAAAAWERLRLWRARAAERESLARLDDRSLRDIGITRLDAQQEARKPFWRA